MNDAMLDDLLDDLVPKVDQLPDWPSVMQRARRGHRRRVALAIAVAVAAALAVAPALGVLLRGDAVHLPEPADRNNVAVVIAPRSGRVLLQVAPRRDRPGFCYVVSGVRAGCVPRTKRGTVVTSQPFFGWSFDDRVRTAVATTVAGRHVPLVVKRFGGRIDATVFLFRDRLSRRLSAIVLRDAKGEVVARVDLR